MNWIELAVEPKNDDMRIDRFLRNNFPGLIQGRIEQALRKGLVKLNSKKVKSSDRVKTGDIIKIQEFLTEQKEEVKSNKKTAEITDKKRKFMLDAILYQDNDIIIINKPIGLAVQGGTNINQSVDDLLEVYKFKDSDEIKLTHRIDKDTSGVLILARNRIAAQKISELFKKDMIEKTYVAVCKGVPNTREGLINMPIEVDGEKKFAKTEFQVIDNLDNIASLIRFYPITGRKHQIRIHASRALNSPIIGDGKYGGDYAFVDGVSIKLHLHARRITFNYNGKKIDVKAPLHPHFIETFRVLGFDKGDV